MFLLYCKLFTLYMSSLASMRYMTFVELYHYQKKNRLFHNLAPKTEIHKFVCNTVEPLYNEVLGTMRITLLYQVSCYIRVKKQRNIKSWDQQNNLVIRGFCYIWPLYNEVPLYITNNEFDFLISILFALEFFFLQSTWFNSNLSSHQLANRQLRARKAL